MLTHLTRTLDDGTTTQVRITRTVKIAPRVFSVTTEDEQLFIIYYDKLIARRRPPLPGAEHGSWMSLIEGYEVLDGPNMEYIAIHRPGHRPLRATLH